MAHIPRGTASTAAAPLLHLWISDGGVVADPDDGSLTWSVYDLSTEEKELSPAAVVGPVTVDLDAHRVNDETGHFAAVRNPLVPSNEPEGAHEVRWSWTVDGKAYSYAERFDVLRGVPRGLGGGYALVSDFRAEDVCEDAASTVKLLRKIRTASDFIDDVTGQFFAPRYLKLRVDGNGQNTLLLGHPILALSLVSILDQPVSIDFDDPELRIYNRHLGGLLDPDDRVCPMVAIPSLRWPFETYGTWAGIFSTNPSLRQNFPRSAQNVVVDGLFGYTDPDGTHLGKTPELIREATLLLVRRSLGSLADPEASFDLQEGHRVKRIKTRDQEIEYAEKRLEGVMAVTGDATVDRILSKYMRPIRAGAA